MPIWVKLIFMLWVVTFVLIICLRMWASLDKNVGRIVQRDYPKWVLATGWFIVTSIVSIIPLFVWLIFLR